MSKNAKKSNGRKSILGNMSPVDQTAEMALNAIDSISTATSQYIGVTDLPNSVKELAKSSLSGSPLGLYETDEWAAEVERSVGTLPETSRMAATQVVLQASTALVKMMLTNHIISQQEHYARFQEGIIDRLDSLESAMRDCCSMMNSIGEQLQGVVQLVSQMQIQTSHTPQVRSNRQVLRDILKQELKDTGMADSDDSIYQMVSMILANARTTDINELERLAIDFAYNLRETSTKLAEDPEGLDDDN